MLASAGVRQVDLGDEGHDRHLRVAVPAADDTDFGSRRELFAADAGALGAFAEEVPFAERRDQALRGRGTSKLLQTLDPSLDFSLGDLLGKRSLRDTYLGVGVSHRSGIFGTSQLLRNVDGGSNYIYGYVETSF